MRTYWMSFMDPDRPKGDRFLGVVVVDVTEDDWQQAVPRLLSKHPNHPDPAEAAWLVAAIHKAWAAKVNPGGEMQAAQIVHPDHGRLPRLTLLSKSDIDALASS